MSSVESRRQESTDTSDESVKLSKGVLEQGTKGRELRFQAIVKLQVGSSGTMPNKIGLC